MNQSLNELISINQSINQILFMVIKEEEIANENNIDVAGWIWIQVKMI